MRFPEPVHTGRLVRRYKRFLADVELEDGSVTTVHCANPGSMLGVSRPGSRVVVSTSSNRARKLPGSLEAIRVGRSWVGIYPGRANQVVEEALNSGRIPELCGHSSLTREPRWAPRSRADFLLEYEKRPPCWIEVKNVSLARSRLALFPDSVTERGQKHLRELILRTQEGDRAVLILMAARSDVDSVGPADGIDPDYGSLLRKAAKAGVLILGYSMTVSRRGLGLGKPLTVDLGPHPYTKHDWQPLRVAPGNKRP